MGIPKKYVPSSLSNNDKKKQKQGILKSRKLYKNKVYVNRPKVKSFKSKESPHIVKTRKVYNVKKVGATDELARKTKCKKIGLSKIIKKGQGAYFSSGSRPNQTAHSWGVARLGSSITGGNAAKVDYHILQEYCSSDSKALKLAKKVLSKKLKTPKIQNGGRVVLRRKKSMLLNKKMDNSSNTHISKLIQNKVKPVRKTDKTLYFSDHPEFKPNLTPKQIFEMGSFGGTYWRPIYSSVTKKNYKNIHKKYPASWWKNVPEEHLTKPFDEYDNSINKYKVKSGTTLEEWEDSGWITKYNPYGWTHWYCDFYLGRRTPDDKRQIQRWLNFTGDKGRFKNRLVNMLKNKNKKYDDYSVSPVIRQGLQHWAYELIEDDLK
jgi:hypothetical protein